MQIGILFHFENTHSLFLSFSFSVFSLDDTALQKKREREKEKERGGEREE